MPEISMPEVRLKDKLPEGLRDVSVEDIQKAFPEVKLPKLDFDFGREAGKAAKRTEKLAKEARKAAEKEAGRAAKALESQLPRRGPNPVLVAVFAMLGGLAIGWLLATNEALLARVRSVVDTARSSMGGRNDFGEDEWDTTDPQAYPASLRAPVESEPYSGTLSESETGIGSEPGTLPEGLGTSDPEEVGAANGHDRSV